MSTIVHSSPPTLLLEYDTPLLITKQQNPHEVVIVYFVSMQK